MTGDPFASDECDLQTLRFATAERYIRQMHPEYHFVFTLEQKALLHWRYDADQAKSVQSEMLAVVCAQARKSDLERGLLIVIEDESCPDETIAVVTETTSIQ